MQKSVVQMQVDIPDAPEPDEAKGSKHKRQGDEAFVKGDFDSAAMAYTQALRHNTSDHIIWANRSAAFLRTGSTEDALQDARRARTLKPEYAKVCPGLCISLWRNLLTSTVSDPLWRDTLRPMPMQAYYREGSALQAMGSWEGAAQAYFQGFRMDPQNAAMAKAFQNAVSKAQEAHAAAHQHS